MTLRGVGLALILTIGVCFWRADVLEAPPYQDQSVGWQEADFLAETCFDYRRLRYEENHWTDREQGCRNYMTSILPSIWAAMMLAFPTTKSTLIAAHVFNIACSAVVAAVVFEWAAQCIGRLGGALVAGLVLTNPLFLSQTEMVGMDVPTAAFGLLSLRLVGKHRFLPACPPALAAFFMKPTGSLAAAAAVGYLSAWRVLGTDRNQPGAHRRWLQALAANFGLLAFEFAVVRWGASRHWSVFDSPALATLNLGLVPWLCPDLLAMAILAAVLTVTALLVGVGARSSLQLSPDSAPSILLLCWTIVVLVTLSVTRVLFIPRYLILAVPCLILALGVGAFLLRPLRPLWVVAATAMIAFNLLNQNGDYFPSLTGESARFTRLVPDADSRSNAFLERSCEYRMEQASAIKAVQTVESLGNERPIFAGNPYTRYLTLPRLGYVDRPLEVYNANHFDDVARQLVCLTERRRTSHGEAAPALVVVWAGVARVNLPEPEPGDRELFRDDHPTEPLIIFEKRLPGGYKSPRDVEEWLLKKTWPGRWPEARLEERTPFLLQTGRLEQARRELAHAAAQKDEAIADDPRIRRLVGELDALERWSSLCPALTKQSPEWTKALCDFLTRTPSPRAGGTGGRQRGESPPRLDDCRTPLAEALLQFEHGRIDTAREMLRAQTHPFAESDDRQAAAEVLHILRLFEQRPLQSGRTTAPATPPSPDSSLFSAISEQQRGDYQAALKSLALVRMQAPENSQAYVLEGIARAQQKDLNQAKAAFAKALTLAPWDSTPASLSAKLKP